MVRTELSLPTEKYYDPTVEVVVDTGVVTVKRGEYMTIFQKEEVPEENE